ncbi:saccharopine dehydrogenase-like oxidoreductase [Oppia nitens]|uniref:saccharopine dehydrogenase-like oxidoreductase n=1 Tax=Oppia nitens TaxID=1686743 RepID=UPI0023DCD186|nr:saccharopine dehydrogenase-like oxidoreductase [Oppia nitens]
MSSKESREFDIIVLGASGFTGQFITEELARSAPKEGIKWAISGRNREKLSQVLITATKETGIELSDIAIIEADVQSDESLRAMTGRTRLVLNAVGPYCLLGEPVVKACILTATNHMDISGENKYIETLYSKYDNLAKEKGIYLISTCGYDCIPNDIGVQYLKKHFPGDINEVESYMKINAGNKGFVINWGTWKSMIHGFDVIDELKRLTTPKQMTDSKFKLRSKNLPFVDNYTDGWCLRFPGSDQSVVQRTQQYRYEKFNERPTQIDVYFSYPNIFILIGVMLLAVVFTLLSMCRWGRSLLESYPEIFSFGTHTKTGPTRQQLKDITCKTTLVGKGWSEKLVDPSDEPSVPPNVTTVVVFEGKDPGYTVTSTCLVQSGITLIKEFDKLPKNGGVLTPGSAFSDTGIYDRLKANGISIEIIK